jgi:D-glycero-alpha-D-manno-heptose-7-phosphate kinase
MIIEKNARSVTTITPQRISFAGGGTDLPDFYRKHGGAVLSATIDKYIYVTVKRHSKIFKEAYRLSYSKTEHVNSLEEIENDIARECLRLVYVEPPLFISTIADLPASSGLGSSSSFAVGLLYALHRFRGEDVSMGQLAEEAARVEIEVLQHPIGKQDQYAAAFGGMNYITFSPDDRVQIDPVWIPAEESLQLFQNSMLFWTGTQRRSSEVLEEQKSKIPQSEAMLLKMSAMAGKCRDLLVDGVFESKKFGQLIDAGWRVKRELAEKISNVEIDIAYSKALSAGALGGKIAGAGGGGFLYLVVPTECQESVRESLHDMVDVPFKFEPRGVRLLSIL